MRAEEMPDRVPPSQCDLQGRIIEDHGVAIRVPLPDRGAMAEAVLTDGWTELFTVLTEADGTVALHQVGSERAAGRQRMTEDRPQLLPTTTYQAAQILAPCSDDAHGHNNFRENTQFTWRFTSPTAPPLLGPVTTESELRAGMNAVVLAHNDCGRPDTIGARHTYGGTTGTGSGIDPTGLCDSHRSDGAYVVDFGDLPEQRLGQACSLGTKTTAGWYEITESDIRFNSAEPWYAGSSTPSTCFEQYSVRGVMTHEAGHIFGMGHVPEATNPHLTMSEQMRPCTLENYTLGRGDRTGLERLYPVS